MKTKRVLLVGGDGLISSSIKDSANFNEFNLISTTRRKDNISDDYYLDLASSDDLPDELLRNIDVVLLMAGISSPDLCENSYNEVYEINVSATKKFIKRCLNESIKVIFFSSDAVYGASDVSVNEKSSLLPLGKYGEMKKEVEDEFNYSDLFKAIRLSYVLSPDDKFIKYLKKTIKQKDVASVFSEFQRCVVWIDDVIQLIYTLITQWNRVENKIINVGGTELLGRDDLARMYKKYGNKELRYMVEEAPSGFFDYRAKRINISVKVMIKILGREPVLIKDIIDRI